MELDVDPVQLLGVHKVNEETEHLVGHISNQAFSLPGVVIVVV